MKYWPQVGACNCESTYLIKSLIIMEEFCHILCSQPHKTLILKVLNAFLRLLVEPGKTRLCKTWVLTAGQCSHNKLIVNRWLFILNILQGSHFKPVTGNISGCGEVYCRL